MSCSDVRRHSSEQRWGVRESSLQPVCVCGKLALISGFRPRAFPPPRALHGIASPWWSVLVLVCATIICLASALTAFIFYVRPLLQVWSHIHHAQPHVVVTLSLGSLAAERGSCLIGCCSLTITQAEL